VPIWTGQGLASIRLARFVELRGGGYFFAPAISALDYLASLAR